MLVYTTVPSPILIVLFSGSIVSIYFYVDAEWDSPFNEDMWIVSLKSLVRMETGTISITISLEILSRIGLGLLES
tara:strand:- start:16521 stop:16745 length:225 start_codon:yes stop_codon:yes gene_type:complete